LLIVQNKNNILSKLYKLNIDPKQIRSERVESTKSYDEECVDDTKQEISTKVKEKPGEEETI